ncbi:Gfo/Idh/MocA family oxidoreductase [Aetokthonos hydrillicola Thurmond2011]|jgi:predicted dehydrogenase|uniref:Gfo/Idh/MocA family oxidoreductase n=1 Tax=Aetokthonos hydrillicola Thurmond2011 TaxID=2712845 RepID=A0AAP5I5H5_9CYAN|nr:Gfo/Idh/MocA family oxidoreductase [Aetokthonos hydrillicola]MBO3459824.1 Gfo/Idh/MocA family oxidoreductase [Aetokthonos hydrillicola CCALA 1050]MBW4584531.1 Gfo/Idh/MocA family oxidoreductase [Aetokthonos hydrillicola CCALA 1050]MDR9895075.1 Gfo/Idh/MocA family oxidoreductase [Aetokthonos hydrillicola Thurmond2011]
MSSQSKTVRWGILGTGLIARLFAEGLRSLPDAQLLAVGSRKLATAQECSRQLNIPRAYGSYEELVKDQDIDIVYVATPHFRHKEDCILCLQAGKAVLCEKPFTVNAQEAREVIAIAREKQLFCMEAMWMRFMPLIQRVKEMIHDGVVGEVRMLKADFGYPVEFNPENRFFNLKLGGGALLDRGIYPLSLAFQLLGTPSQIVSQASIGQTGVDEQGAILLSYPQNQLAILSTSLRSQTSNEAVIICTRGQIRIHAPFFKPHQLSISYFSEPSSSSSASQSSGLKQKLPSFIQQNKLLKRSYLELKSFISRKQAKNIVQLYDGNGYNYEAAEVMRCIRNGEIESKIMPLDETLKIMETMDTIRGQWNLKYPCE